MTDDTGAGADASGDGPATTAYDVLVAGAGSGGVSAAIEAARHGAHVLLVERTGWVGGQKILVAGPEAANSPRMATGINSEFQAKTTAYYQQAGKPNGAATLSVEPHVARDLLTQVLADGKVEVRLHTSVTSVQNTASAVTGARLSDGTTISTRVIVDATEFGDVIPLAGAEYRVGNQLSTKTIDAHACVQDMTYVATIRKYPGAVPAGLLVTSPPPGYDSPPGGPAFLPAASYPYTVHTGFQGMATATGLENGLYPWDFYETNHYRAMPDSANPVDYDFTSWSAITRSNVNFANDYAEYTVANTADGGQAGVSSGTLAVTYVEDPATRLRVDCTAKALSLQFLYYVQHELAAQGGGQWSFADDEGFDKSGDFSPGDCPEVPAALKGLEQLMPPLPYVRESRRIVPVRALTVADLQDTGDGEARPQHTAVARGSGRPDLHYCRDDADLEADLGETYALVGTAAVPYQIPFEAMIPERVDGLLAAEKNYGLSRLAQGTARLQGTTFLSGQAVGAIAALAVQHAVPPRTVDPFEAQRMLVADGAGLTLQEFTDVPTTDAHWSAIQLAAVRGVMSGTSPTTFDPTGDLLREQAAVVFSTLLRYDTSKPPAQPDFADVPASDPFYAFIEAMAQHMLTGGCDKAMPLPHFCPTNPVTRAQLAVFLVKGLNVPFVNVPPIFGDETNPSDPFYPYVQTAGKTGLMTGCGGGMFCPGTNVTRGDTAASVLAAMIFAGPPP